MLPYRRFTSIVMNGRCGLSNELVDKLAKVPDGWKPLAWAERLEQMAEGLMPSKAGLKPAYWKAAEQVRRAAKDDTERLVAGIKYHQKFPPDKLTGIRRNSATLN